MTMRKAAAFGAFIVLSGAWTGCGSESSESGSGGSSGSGTGASSGSGGGGQGGAGAVAGSSSGGAGGAAASGGAGGAGGSAGGSCPGNVTHATSGNHIIAEVSWPATTGLEAGSGQLHIWTRAVLDFGAPDGAGQVPATGKVKPCGSLIPALTKTQIAGGGMVQTVIPDDVWDKPGMPEFDATGTLGGFEIGATIVMDPVVSLVGLTMTDPNGPWPSAAQQIDAVDHDGDGQPGILAKPRTDPPFSAPPTSLLEALNPNGKRAVEVYIVTRTKVQLGGTRDSCTSATGSATIYSFDSHVVGCKRNDGPLCSQGESDFIDQNQPKFTVKSAVYQMVQLDEGASCADVRAALPL